MVLRQKKIRRSSLKKRTENFVAPWITEDILIEQVVIFFHKILDPKSEQLSNHVLEEFSGKKYFNVRRSPLRMGNKYFIQSYIKLFQTFYLIKYISLLGENYESENWSQSFSAKGHRKVGSTNNAVRLFVEKCPRGFSQKVYNL